MRTQLYLQLAINDKKEHAQKRLNPNSMTNLQLYLYFVRLSHSYPRSKIISMHTKIVQTTAVHHSSSSLSNANEKG